MRISSLTVVVATVLLSTTAICNSPVVWWQLAEVVDERTLKVRSDRDDTKTITLAGIGRAKDNRAAIAYITRRLHDHRFTFWPVETNPTNWYEQPMYVMLDMDLPGGHGGSSSRDFPLLNEELLAWGHTPFNEITNTVDAYGLKARLLRAKAEGERRQKQRTER